MASGWQTVRVFISSTFRDMHAERDQLVKVVFPSLRERLEKYRIHLVDIDLRWGVTKEQADDDRALDLCLQQIDDCRPFFIGILGERYGYVPQEIPSLSKPAYGLVQGMTGKSITATKRPPNNLFCIPSVKRILVENVGRSRSTEGRPIIGDTSVCRVCTQR